MIKYYVNEQCIGCGLCAEIAPEVFKMKDGFAVAYRDNGENAEEARKSCPVEAIQIKEEE